MSTFLSSHRLSIKSVVTSFLDDRTSMGISPRTIIYYKEKFKQFLIYCDQVGAQDIMEIDADFIRKYMIYLEETGHNNGGRHCYYRTIKSLLMYFEKEFEPDDWKNPIRKVKPPKLDKTLLDPIILDDIKKLLAVCRDTEYGDRDKAMILGLLDTGCRAREFLSINIEDIDTVTGAIRVKGKGAKERTVFIGKKTRRAIRAYLKNRTEANGPLWVSQRKDRMDYFGLRSMLKRRADDAGIEPPPLHAFRRTFLLEMMRNNANVYATKSISGHEDFQVLGRYVKMTEEDLKRVHTQSAPVDHSL